MAEPLAGSVLLGKTTSAHAGWWGKVSRLRFEEWSVGGEHLREVAGDLPWFPEYTLADIRGDDPPTLSLVHAFSVDEEDRLWILSRVPDPGWRADQASHGGNERLIRRQEYDDYWDSRLDVFDLTSRRHLGTRRWDDVLGFQLVSVGGVVHLLRLEYATPLHPQLVLYRYTFEPA